MKKILSALALGAIAFVTPAQAVLLANYDFQNSNGVTTITQPNTTLENFTPGAFDIPGTPAPVAITYSANNAVIPGDVSIRPSIVDASGGTSNQVVMGFSNALAAGYYYDFTVTADAGFALNIDNLSLRTYI